MTSMDGCRCRMHYRTGGREAGLPEGETGTILLTHRGKRLVRLDSGRKIVCPMWNALPEKGRGTMKMKALSLWQPWATWIAEGQKTIETRMWRTDYRGPLLICAAKTIDPGKGPNDPRERLMWSRTLPSGKAVAIADLLDCRPMTEADEAAAMCPSEPGRFAWVLDSIYPIEPFAVRGRQRLWDQEIPEGVMGKRGTKEPKVCEGCGKEAESLVSFGMTGKPGASPWLCSKCFKERCEAAGKGAKGDKRKSDPGCDHECATCSATDCGDRTAPAQGDRIIEDDPVIKEVDAREGKLARRDAGAKAPSSGSCEDCDEKECRERELPPKRDVVKEIDVREGKLARLEALGSTHALALRLVAEKRTIRDDAEAAFDVAEANFKKADSAAEGIARQIVEVVETDAEKVDDLPLFRKPAQAPATGPWQGADDPRGGTLIVDALGSFGKRATKALEEAGVRTIRDLLRNQDEFGGIDIAGLGPKAAEKMLAKLEEFIMSFGTATA